LSPDGIDAPSLMVYYFFFRKAFNLVVLFWIFCGTMLLLLVLTVTADEEKAQKSIKDSLHRRRRRRLPPVENLYSNITYNPIRDSDLRNLAAYSRIADEENPTTTSAGVLTETITVEKIIVQFESTERKYVS
jgi:hypothetical protein